MMRGKQYGAADKVATARTWLFVRGSMSACRVLSMFCLAARLSAEDAAPPAATVIQPELPFWPIAFETPGVPAGKPDKTGSIRAPLLAWVAPGATHVRALFIIPNNSDSKIIGQHGAVRAVAAKREMAVVFLRAGDIKDVQEVLNALAAKTGIPEIKHAPWIVMGKSSRGPFPIQMEWMHPKRTIAGFSYHAESPTWPPSDGRISHHVDSPWPPSNDAVEENILHVNANGEGEWGGTWYLHVRPSLLNYRARSKWLTHQVVAKDIGHGDYPDAHGGAGWGQPWPGKITCIMVWDYLALYMDKAIALRVPTDKYAADGPVELKPVDESAGYLIDPFAVEDLFKQPRCPLKSSPSGYVMGEAGSGTFAAIPPAANFTPPEDVPVVPLTAGQSPANWLITETANFAMKKDPMVELGGLENLRPKPGDKVMIDDFETAFQKINPNSVPAGGGIALAGGSFTLIAYTVLDVPETMRVRLKAPFSVSGRLQVVLNGIPVEHAQVVELQKGLYPMLAVLRKKSMAGTGWRSITPLFDKATDQEVEQAKVETAEKAEREALQKKLLAEGLKNATPLIRKAADVPKDERKNFFWVADRELAEAWFKLHAIHGQKFEAP